MELLENKGVGGEPRPVNDIEAALQAVKTWMIKDPLAIGPDGRPKVIHLIVIKDALEELLEIRHQEKTS